MYWWISWKNDCKSDLKAVLLHEKCTLQGLKRYEKNPAKEIIKLTFDNNTANASS